MAGLEFRYRRFCRARAGTAEFLDVYADEMLRVQFILAPRMKMAGLCRDAATNSRGQTKFFMSIEL